MLPCSSDALPFLTTRSSSSKPVTSSEKTIEMENGPVTGARASLLMATVGDVVSAPTQLSWAPPPASNASNASRSAGSTDNPYSSLTATTRAANHAPCRAGTHSPASRSLFCDRFTLGSAIVRLSRSLAMSRRRSSAIPESCASARATICSMSVAAVPSALISNAKHEYGVYTCPPAFIVGGNMAMMSSSRLEYADPNESRS